MVLLSRLCTSYNITDPESARIKNSFDALWMDVYSIAQGACTPPLKAPAYGSPRDPKPFLPEIIEDLRALQGILLVWKFYHKLVKTDMNMCKYSDQELK